MARIMFQEGGECWNFVAKTLDKASSVEVLTAAIVGLGERKGVKYQLAVVETMAQIATLRGRSESIPSTGDSIRDGQARKFAQYGEKAFCLSEKQVACIARDLIGFQQK